MPTATSYTAADRFARSLGLSRFVVRHIEMAPGAVNGTPHETAVSSLAEAHAYADSLRAAGMKWVRVLAE